MTILAKKVTIRDLAREAGVSLSTVSGVLNGSNEFSEQTKKKVWDIANSLNYMPNTQARKLRAGEMMHERSKTGIIMHITHLAGETPVGSSFESERSVLLAWEASKLGLYPLSYWYYRLKGFQCLPVLNGTVDGAIVGTPHLEVINILRGKLPLVLMDVPFSLGNSDVPIVNMDFRSGIVRLINELQKRGHRRIGMMYSAYVQDGVSQEIPFINIIKEAAQLHQLDIHPEGIIEEDIRSDNHEAMMKVIAQKFEPLIRKKEITAIICPSTGYASALYENFVRMGIKVPDDISLIGGVHSEFKVPPYGICSMLHNWPQLIETSLKVLKRLIDGKADSNLNYLVKPEIYVGTSLKDVTRKN